MCVCVSEVSAVRLYYLSTRCKSIASIFLFPARKYDNGEYLNITGITRDQAGDYECSALNDIASPDTKTVKVTVNCKYDFFYFLFIYLFFTLAALFSVHMKGTALTSHSSRLMYPTADGDESEPSEV